MFTVRSVAAVVVFFSNQIDVCVVKKNLEKSRTGIIAGMRSESVSLVQNDPFKTEIRSD